MSLECLWVSDLIVNSWVYSLWGAHWALTTIGHLIIFLACWTWSGRCLHVSGWRLWSHFPIKPSIQKIMLNNANVKCKWMRRIRSRVKILAASDKESHCTIWCTWVLSPNMYMLLKGIYNRYPVRDQCIRACKNFSTSTCVCSLHMFNT